MTPMQTFSIPGNIWLRLVRTTADCGSFYVGYSPSTRSLPQGTRSLPQFSSLSMSQHQDKSAVKLTHRWAHCGARDKG
eukprot:12895503-Prorocentrum_lima.AAC.1